jgi:hypothetical protein
LYIRVDISWEPDYRKENQLKQKKKEDEEKEKAVRRVYAASLQSTLGYTA